MSFHPWKQFTNHIKWLTVYGYETRTVICQMKNNNALTDWKWSKSLSQNHKEQINQSTIKLSSSLQRALNTESLTSMQINNRKQSGKKGSKCRHLGFFFFIYAGFEGGTFWKESCLHVGEVPHGSAVWVCVYIYVLRGYFAWRKKNATLVDSRLSFHDNLSNISSVNHTILAFHACWLRREIMPFTSGDFLLSVCILIRSY